jgi:carboxyl-terminal processing protease
VRTRAALSLLATLAFLHASSARGADERPSEHWDGYLLDTPVGNFPFQVDVAWVGDEPEARADLWPPASFEDTLRRGEVFSVRMKAFFGDLQLSGEVHDSELRGRWQLAEPPASGEWHAWRRPPSTEDGPERRRAAADRLLDLMRPLYPFWERKGLSPEHVRQRWTEAATRASSREEFLREMGRLLAEFNDGHTTAISNPALQAVVKGRVNGVFVDSADGRFFLAQALPELVDLRSGPLEIVAVDGEPVAARALRLRREIPLTSSSPRHLQHLVCVYLLSGPPDKPAVVRVRSSSGRRFDLSIRRGGPRLPTVEWRQLSPDVGYIRVRRFDFSDGGPEAFDQALEALRESRALVLDLRDNGGGTAIVGLVVLGRLITTSSVAATGAYPAAGGFGRSLPLPMSPWGDWQYSRPVVALMNGGTYSTAEFVAAALRDSGRAFLVGSRTGGGVSNKITVRLPAGLVASFATMDGRRAGGEPFEGQGVAPDRVITPRAADLRAGNDPVLDAGLSHLRQGLQRAARRSAVATQP